LYTPNLAFFWQHYGRRVLAADLQYPGRAFELYLVNAQSIKRMPGRKTDMKDAEWIASLMQVGLLQRSFIPSRDQRELRDLTPLPPKPGAGT